MPMTTMELQWSYASARYTLSAENRRGHMPPLGIDESSIDG